MHRQNEIEAERLKLTKQVRREIKLKHSLLADDALSHLSYKRKLPDEEKAARKSERSFVRAQHTDAADREIGQRLPNIMQEFDDAIMDGQLYGYDEDLGRLVQLRPLRILDFDVECRPMAFYGGDWVTKEITAIAWRFLDQADEDKTSVWLLRPSETLKQHTNKRINGLRRFIAAYNEADIVTGHYIRGFDLPLINAHCVNLGLHPLEPKTSHDTKGDLIAMGGVSKSQENLAAHFETNHPKVGMNTAKWELANALVREGREETRQRVVGDVEQHMEFRYALLKNHALKPPQVWTSGARMEDYVA